jgi:NAD(P)-dependent dehydrogenase (short-subunit alcohol dehydrogenase family)
MESTSQSKVVIAGGSSGIGLATARLLSETFQVTVTGRNAARLQSARDTNINTAAVDSTDRKTLDTFFKTHGPFHHLVLALSGAKGGGTFADLSLQQLREGFEGKFWPHLETLQAALPHLSSGGSITFITATSATAKLHGTSGLAAINGALEIMVPILGKELKPLRVNAVSPGVVDTAWWDFLPTADKQQAFEYWGTQTLAGRVGKPEDVATAISFLIANTYVTGQVLKCDGGLQ